jgi:hypothetical protein
MTINWSKRLSVGDIVEWETTHKKPFTRRGQVIAVPRRESFDRPYLITVLTGSGKTYKPNAHKVRVIQKAEVNMITHQTIETTVLSENSTNCRVVLLSATTKTVDHITCDKCGHKYERAGLCGVFEELFEGCPKCGEGKEDWV